MHGKILYKASQSPFFTSIKIFIGLSSRYFYSFTSAAYLDVLLLLYYQPSDFYFRALSQCSTVSSHQASYSV